MWYTSIYSINSYTHAVESLLELVNKNIEWIKTRIDQLNIKVKEVYLFKSILRSQHESRTDPSQQ